MAKKESEKPQGLIIPELKLVRMTVPVRGTTPLITNRIPDFVLDDIETKNEGGQPPKRIRSAEEQYRDALYLMEGPNSEELYGFPASGMKQAIVAAGGRFTDLKMTVLRGILTIHADLLEIQGPGPRLRKDAARNQQGNIVPAIRPCFDEWWMEVPIAFNASVVTQAQVLSLFELAGFSIGIGCWRPELNGTFGTFALDRKKK